MTLSTCPIPVSYTHLDVYKRQAKEKPLMYKGMREKPQTQKPYRGVCVTLITTVVSKDLYLQGTLSVLD